MATFVYPFIRDCLATPAVLLEIGAATYVMHDSKRNNPNQYNKEVLCKVNRLISGCRR